MDHHHTKNARRSVGSHARHLHLGLTTAAVPALVLVLFLSACTGHTGSGAKATERRTEAASPLETSLQTEALTDVPATVTTEEADPASEMPTDPASEPVTSVPTEAQTEAPTEVPTEPATQAQTAAESETQPHIVLPPDWF